MLKKLTGLWKNLFGIGLGVLLALGITWLTRLNSDRIQRREAASPARQAAQSAFITAMNRAFETKSPEGLLALYCWDGVNDEEKAKMTKIVGSFFSPRFAPNGPKFSFTPVSLSKEDAAVWAAQHEFTRNGVRYHPNLSCEVGEVRVVGKNQSKDGGSFTYLLAVGEKDGKLWFISNAPKP